MAAAARMAGGGSRRAPHAPAADDRGARPGRRTDATTRISTAAPAWRRRLEHTGDERRLSRVEREFLEAGRDAQERELTSAQRRARRLRALLAVVAAALVVAVIAGTFALIQRGSARHTATVAQAGRLAAQSREAAAQHPDLGLLLALEAGRLDDSVDSRGALLGALQHASRIRAWLQGFDSPVVASAFSPDGRLLATTTIEGTTLWDTATWKPHRPALAFVAGRLGGGRLQPRRADTGDRGRRRAASSSGTSRPGKCCGS